LTSSVEHRRLSFRRAARLLLWLCAGFFVFAFLALRAMAAMLSRYDDPQRLEAEIHVTRTSHFTIRWVRRHVAAADGELVFVHGSPGGAGVWHSQFVQPYPGADLIAYDRPGYGGSGPTRRQPHLQEQVDGLMALLAVASTNRVLLVGHSYGSPICLLAALEHPERVGGVLLIGSDVDPAEEKPMWIGRLFGWRVVSWLLPHNLRQCNREMLTVRGDLEVLQKNLPQLAVPVVMLHGGRDQLVPVENVAWLQGQLTAAGKKELFTGNVLPDYNHFIPWEHPEAVAAAITILKQKAQNNPTSGFKGS
jgi:pimeloyl-ACP methyl ester carboxylesterase